MSNLEKIFVFNSINCILNFYLHNIAHCTKKIWWVLAVTNVITVVEGDSNFNAQAL